MAVIIQDGNLSGNRAIVNSNALYVKLFGETSGGTVKAVLVNGDGKLPFMYE